MMKRQHLSRLLDAGILVLVIAAARLAIAQEPRATEPPRPTAPPRVVAPVAPRATPALPLAPTAPTRPATPDDAPRLEPRPGTTVGPGVTPPMAPPTLASDGRVALQLKDGSRLVGKLVGMDKLKLKASFGEIDVPVEAILGLKLHEASRPTETAALTATVLFKNGDVLTAEPLISSIKLEAAWGDSTIAGKHVESLVTTAEKVAWAFDGSKWHIVREGAGHSMPASYPTGVSPRATLVPFDPYGSRPPFRGSDFDGAPFPGAIPSSGLPPPTEFSVPMALPAPAASPSPSPSPR